MNLEDYQFIDNEQIDNSIIKRDFLKVYHQQGANLNDPDQNIEFIFGKNNNYQQIGNAHLEFDITVRTDVGLDDTSNIRLTNNALAYCFKEAILSTTGGSDLEHNKYVGQVSTIMRLLTSKDGDLSSCFDTNGENPLNDNNVLKRILINNHTDGKKGKENTKDNLH